MLRALLLAWLVLAGPAALAAGPPAAPPAAAPSSAAPRNGQAGGQISGRRVALVIGNGGYRSVDRLPNAPNDARLIAATLRGAGFVLVGGGAQLDLDRAHLAQAVQDFGRALAGADVGLFYYAGHGLQVQGVNWLVPVDANPARPQDLDFQMVDADLVLRQMDGAGTRLNLMLLDACRNNPFANRGLRAIQAGLAEMRAPEGTLISYATQPGSVAVEGTGTNSPYTAALAAGMQRPGQDIFRMFNQVGLQVKRQTGGSQQPWVSTSPIDGDFAFTPTAASLAVPPPPLQPPSPPEASPLGPPAPAQSAPRTTPAAPVPLDARADLAMRLADAARAQPCSLLDARVAVDGTVEVTGMALPGPGLDRLVRQAGPARAIRPSGPAVELLPPAACGPLTAVGDAVRATRAATGPMIRLPGRQAVAGSQVTLLLAGAAGGAWALDLYRPGGTVQHLTAAPTEEGPNLSLTMDLPGPTGTLVLVAMTGSAAAGLQGRPETEQARAYLAALRPHLTASPGVRADLAVLDLRPAPRPAAATALPPRQPPRTATPAAARPLPRSAGCGSILERAQLGEALSDADRATLRTGCR